MSPKAHIGRSIKIALAKREVKSKELAEGVGVTEQLVTKWICTGRVSCKNLFKIVGFFEMEMSEFFSLSED